MNFWSSWNLHFPGILKKGMYGAIRGSESRGSLSDMSQARADNLMENTAFIWGTLVRFYKKTRILEVTCAAMAGVYAYALFFGMYINQWSFTQSTYFFMYTIATIGYDYPGKMTVVAQWLLSVYVLTSVLVCGLLLGLFVAAITDASEASIEMQLRDEHDAASLTGGVNDRLLRGVRVETRVEARARIELEIAGRTIWTSGIQMFVVLLVGVGAVIFFDRGIAADSGVLFILETVTTVGYGTAKLDTTMAKWFAIVFIGPGCFAWARFVAAVSRYPLALRKYRELSDNIDRLKNDENSGISMKAGRKLIQGHRHLKNLVAIESSRSGGPKKPHPDAEVAEKVSIVDDDSDVQDIRTALSKLRREDFVIQWLLTTGQVTVQDVLDAHDLYGEFDSNISSSSMV